MGTALVMSDYSEHGAIPVEDAAVEHPPTEEDVREAQERNYPEQAASASYRIDDEDDDDGLDRRPDPGQLPSDSDVQAERQAEGVVDEYEHAEE